MKLHGCIQYQATICHKHNNILPAPVAGSIPAVSGNIFFVEIDHEIFSKVTLSLSLIQEVQLSVSGERMCTTTSYVEFLHRELILPSKTCGQVN